MGYTIYDVCETLGLTKNASFTNPENIEDIKTSHCIGWPTDVGDGEVILKEDLIDFNCYREEKKPGIVVVDQNNYKKIFGENAESNAKYISKVEAILNEEFQKNGYISKRKLYEMLGIRDW